jgi:DNA-binding NtrC family response regulator
LQGKSWQEVEAAVIRHHLRAANGNRSQAAATLGISRTTLYERLRKLEGAAS